MKSKYMAVGGVIVIGAVLFYFLRKSQGPGVQVALEWDESGPYAPNTSHIVTITLHNPTQQDWIYSHALLIGGYNQGNYFGNLITAGQSLTKPMGVLIPPEYGTYSVVVEVSEDTTGQSLGSFSFGNITVG